MKMMDSKIVGPINLGNPNEFTMLQLAEKIIQMTESKSKIVFWELPEDDPKQRQPDITKAKELLNWKPEFALETGLQYTINYFKEIL